ncbi:transcriptional regulatory protein AlgP-like isoform X1 [Eriocheir sinensis]|uniref:transcriptional regulatory protein AlgP-like isoform X1 n=1 Tax=Eriocheir sinensis TaxID=95602 RepID=UPI0021CA2021|nr:transcriptional regulatory protein AlgP-like isoform X1 [Eriocheir sinensis]XP_050702622.1 transcriptional regulatory protein AlgP-like isoform X1 [Eriocheir sinensis]XP_050702633.1 transcriptional regulatory protein AlgP-like isoform X1 [Eriocheir sinensis]XP_050702643.1 transcriptional regulatory protein AlgP-like isoform X1 [Eriocheir sinensis]XP_050702651.1 transcriptional regulatory protein AlgP-like isoform X1 [Eriocheir sinensis]
MTEAEGGVLAAVVVAILVAWLLAAWLLLALLPRPGATAATPGRPAAKETSVTHEKDGASSDENSASSAGDSGGVRRRGPGESASTAPAPPPCTPLRCPTQPPSAFPAPQAASTGWPDKPLTADTPQSRGGAADGAIWPAGGPAAATGGEARRRLLAKRRQLISRLYDPAEDAAHVLSLYFTPPSRPASRPTSRPTSRHVSRERDAAAATPRRRSAPTTPAPASPLPAAARVGRGTCGDGLAGAARGCGGPDTYSDDSGISVDDQHQQPTIFGTVAGDLSPRNHKTRVSLSGLYLFPVFPVTVPSLNTLPLLPCTSSHSLSPFLFYPDPSYPVLPFYCLFSLPFSFTLFLLLCPSHYIPLLPCSPCTLSLVPCS